MIKKAIFHSEGKVKKSFWIQCAFSEMGTTPQIGKDADENKTFWRKPFIKNNKVNGVFLKQKVNRMYCNKKGSAK